MLKFTLKNFRMEQRFFLWHHHPETKANVNIAIVSNPAIAVNAAEGGI